MDQCGITWLTGHMNESNIATENTDLPFEKCQFSFSILTDENSLLHENTIYFCGAGSSIFLYSVIPSAAELSKNEI